MAESQIGTVEVSVKPVLDAEATDAMIVELTRRVSHAVNEAIRAAIKISPSEQSAGI